LTNLKCVTAVLFGLYLVLCPDFTLAQEQPNWALLIQQVQRIEITYRSDTVDPIIGTTPAELDKTYELAVMFRAPFKRPLLRIVDGMANSHYEPTRRRFGATWAIRVMGADETPLTTLYLDKWGTYGSLNGQNVAITDSRVLEAVREALCYFPASNS